MSRPVTFGGSKALSCPSLNTVGLFCQVASRAVSFLSFPLRLAPSKPRSSEPLGSLPLHLPFPGIFLARSPLGNGPFKSDSFPSIFVPGPVEREEASEVELAALQL